MGVTPQTEQLLTKAEACSFLRISPTTLQRRIKEKAIIPIRFGHRTVRFTKESLLASGNINLQDNSKA